MQVSYNWLNEYVDVGISPKDLGEKITMGGVEVEEVKEFGKDSILNLAPTPNRGDCLSIVGVAREVSALLSKKAKLPEISPLKGKGKMSDWVKVIVKDENDTPRYTSRVIEGVKIGPSPEWLKTRVESVGIRSINNVVDATNFVLMELGQPVHAFDLRFLKGNSLIIDRPSKDCKLKALDEFEYTFTKEDILNLDAERPIGAAGIMGGENSGVADDTTTLVLESAYFDPRRVRRTSKRTGLASESSKRFEKGVDPEGVIDGLHRLTQIIARVAGGTPSSDWVDLYPKPFKKTEIELETEEVNWLLGTELDSKTIEKVLLSIGCTVKGSKKMKVQVPLYRPDLTRPVDLIEEVARLYGYSKIGDSMPVSRVYSLIKPTGLEASLCARESLRGLGFYEVRTYSFTSEEKETQFGNLSNAVEISNPLTLDMSFMRTTLLPSILDVLQTNLNRQNADLKIFELNKVFFASGKDLPNEELRLTGAITGARIPGNWDTGKDIVDIYDAKGAIWSIFSRMALLKPEVGPITNINYLHPVDSFGIAVNGKNIGFCGRLHPSIEKKYDFSSKVYVFELDFGPIRDEFMAKEVQYKPISKYPAVLRDVALLVNSQVTHKELLQSFKKYVNNLVQRIDLFDIYKGKGIPEGKKSMAYRISFGSNDKTLSDEEVDQVFDALIDSVKKDIGAEIR